MLIGNSSSCFLDACELAFGLSAHTVAARMKQVTPDCPFETIGYPPTLVGAASLELYGLGLARIDPVPTTFDAEGNPARIPGTEGFVEYVSSWFRRPGFRCVIQGPKLTDGEEHACAWNGQAWIDPSNPEQGLAAPTVNVRTIWLFTLPAEAEAPADAEPESADSDD